MTFNSSKSMARVWWAPLSLCSHSLQLETPWQPSRQMLSPVLFSSGVTILPTAPRRVCSFLCHHQALPLGPYLALEHFQQLNVKLK